MEIEFQDIFERDVKTGMNLFLGSGFSIYSKDAMGKFLPLGFELEQELSEYFNTPNLNNLSRTCTIIDAQYSQDLKEYLINRFSVSEFDDCYNVIPMLPFPRIFTTNIDDLIYKVFNNSRIKFVNNVIRNGSVFHEPNGVDYIPLHGTVEHKDEKFLFNTVELATSFNSQRTAWTSLTLATDQLPSLFIGYSLNDVGAIEALFANGGNKAGKNKWIVLKSREPDAEQYFRALGFKIIISDTRILLNFLKTLVLNREVVLGSEDSIEEIFPEALVPHNNAKLKIRPIEEFFWVTLLFGRMFYRIESM